MPKAIYISISEINQPQTNIMKFVNVWVRKQKTPIPLKEIVLNMQKEGIHKDTTMYSLKILLQKGYLRRAITISNKSSFVQLRTVEP